MTSKPVLSKELVIAQACLPAWLLSREADEGLKRVIADAKAIWNSYEKSLRHKGHTLLSEIEGKDGS